MVPTVSLLQPRSARGERSGLLKLVERRKLHTAVLPLLARVQVDFKPGTPVAEMSIAQRQLHLENDLQLH